MKSFIVIILFLYVENIAQTPDGVAPLAQNNYWSYYDNDIWKSIVVTDTAKYVDSIKYYEVEVERRNHSFSYKRLFRLREDGFYVMRRDTSFPEFNHEQIYYKKDAQLGDQWQQAGNYVNINDTTIFRDTLYFTLLDTAEVFFWNKTRTIKLLHIRNNGLLNNEQIWSEEFGKLSDKHNEGLFIDNLWGCIINIVLYGDTTVTGIEENEIISFDYRLSQNYPNPFNPSTTIKYSIPAYKNPLPGGARGGLVTLKVYDVLGNEVSVLVNEEKSPGEYEIIFNASNLSSGVYYYKLTAGYFTNVKKLILLK